MSTFFLKQPDCVLIHIPKSAGRSIRMGVWDGRFEGPYYGPLPEKLKSYFSFAFVRNPYDRLASIWRMFSRGTKNSKNYARRWKPDPTLTISEILDITANDSIIYDERRSKFAEIIKHHSLPMTHPFNGLNDASFIGRFENIQEDWKKISKVLGLKESTLPHLNYTMAANERIQFLYRQHFDLELRKRVEKIYSEDLARFNYEF